MARPAGSASRGTSAQLAEALDESPQHAHRAHDTDRRAAARALVEERHSLERYAQEIGDLFNAAVRRQRADPDAAAR